jgi:peptide/nickel transport system permease protein
MKAYIARRFLYMILLLVMASMVSFIVITLPPGDYLTSYIMRLKAQGQDVGLDEELALRRQYGLDQPYYIQYFKWASQMLRGNMGRSFEFNRPVWDVIQPRLGMTILVAAVSLVFTYVVAIPIGIYSAVRQYSIGDYVFTVIGFAGVSIPNFLLALVVMVFAYRTFGTSIGGLFSIQYVDAPWSLAKVQDLIKHLPVPIIVIGLSGTAWLIRTMRATLLDELHKPYVQTARAKGLREGKLLVKYPIRVALNPIASTVGWALPGLFSGQTIISIVLDLPTIGPILLRSLMTEDMFLAASTLFITTALTLVGTLISDMLLVWLDPRIQYT